MPGIGYYRLYVTPSTGFENYLRLTEYWCRYCGERFLSRPTHKVDPQLCSASCRNKIRIKTHHLTCQQCGVVFSPGFKWRIRQFCSPGCATTHRNLAQRAALEQKFLSSRGLSKLYCERCYLSKDEIATRIFIVPKNGDKTDVRPGNLQCLCEGCRGALRRGYPWELKRPHAIARAAKRQDALRWTK